MMVPIKLHTEIRKLQNFILSLPRIIIKPTSNFFIQLKFENSMLLTCMYLAIKCTFYFFFT